MNFILKKKENSQEKEVRRKLFNEQLLRRLDEKYNQNSTYAEANAGLRMLALLVSYLANLFSFITAVYLVTELVMQWLGHHSPIVSISMAVVFGLGIPLVIEYGKRKMSNTTMQPIITEGIYNPLGIVSLLAIQSLSIGISFYASQLYPEAQIEKPKTRMIASNFSTPFNDRIARMKAEIAKIREERKWKGRISNVDQKEINKLNELIEKAEDERSAAIIKEKKRLAAQNAADEQEYQKEVTGQKDILGWVTIMSEFIFLLCYQYLERYDWKSAVERMKLEQQDQDDQQTIINQQPAATTQNSGQRAPQTNQIGFKYGSPPPPEDEKTELPTLQTERPTPSVGKLTEAVGPPTEAVVIEKKKTIPILEDFLETPEKEQTTEAVGELTEAVELPTETVTEYITLENKKPCEQCGKLMSYKYTRKKYCSAKCRYEANKSK